MKYFHLIALFALSLSFSGCFQKFDNTYSGPDQVEFQRAVLLAPSAVVSLPSGVAPFPITVVRRTGLTPSSIANVQSVDTLSEQINLIGRQRASATRVNFVVDQQATDSLVASYRRQAAIASQAAAFGIYSNLQAAVEGTHFSLSMNPTSNGVSIPANSSFGVLNVILRGGAFQPSFPNTEEYAVVFRLEGPDPMPAHNYRRVGFIIRY